MALSPNSNYEGVWEATTRMWALPTHLDTILKRATARVEDITVIKPGDKFLVTDYAGDEVITVCIWGKKFLTTAWFSTWKMELWPKKV